MDDGVLNVQELLLIDAAVRPHEVSRRGSGHSVSEDGRSEQVRTHLAVRTNVNVAVACRRAFHREQSIEHIRIKPVLIEPRLRTFRIILRCIEDLIAHVLAVVQLAVLLVVCIDDGSLVVSGYLIIRGLLDRDDEIAQPLFFKLGILLQEHVLLDHLHVKDHAAVLQMLDARLPEQIEDVAPCDVDIP